MKGLSKSGRHFLIHKKLLKLLVLHNTSLRYPLVSSICLKNMLFFKYCKISLLCKSLPIFGSVGSSPIQSQLNEGYKNWELYTYMITLGWYYYNTIIYVCVTICSWDVNVIWVILTAVQSVPLDDIFLLLDGLSQWVTQSDLGKVLQGWVDGVTDGVIEHTLHPSHQHLQSLYHCHHLPKAQHFIRDKATSGSKHMCTWWSHNRPPQEQTSPRLCSCIWWLSRTPQHCQGNLCWSTCQLGEPVSRSTVGKVRKFLIDVARNKTSKPIIYQSGSNVLSIKATNSTIFKLMTSGALWTVTEFIQESSIRS